MELSSYLYKAVDAIRQWEASWGAFAPHDAMAADAGRVEEALGRYLERLEGNYPFFHPRYAGQMLKPPHPAAVVGYLAAMLINPNNHALDGGPPTGAMEKEVVRRLAGLFSFPEDALGHLTGGGTMANLEALFVARQLHPDRAVAFSADAHYTHARMCDVLGLATVEVEADGEGRMRLDRLEEAIETREVGTVVVTAGTTGVGVVDPIAEIAALAAAHGVRVHVDAAYGGFFALLAGEEGSSPLGASTRRHLRAIASCDSVAIDPHKHGLQPYGCGCILFRDPGVGRFYKHDSPYTYFTSNELHLGEISLECSRPGAAAGALWLTLEVLPLEPGRGLGPILAASLRAARDWHERLHTAELLAPYQAPELDIVTFFPRARPHAVSAVDEAAAALFRRAMDDPEDPLFLSVLRVDAGRLAAASAPGLHLDRPTARVLRSVLMKPEHERYVPHLHETVSRHAAAILSEPKRRSGSA